jgi:FAD/FMN-containing dehydrogenase
VSAERNGTLDYAQKEAQLLAAIAAAPSPTEHAVGLSKTTSNLFRDRATRRPRIDLSHFNAVVRVDPAQGIVEAEGMTTFVHLADATLAHGTMPAVVPQLKSITLGGAVAGVGIEATSFRHGLVHDTIVAMDILTGDGHIVSCTADNEHRDLYHGFPNSYGTLGYALKLTARTLPVKRHVRVDHARHGDEGRFFADLARACTDDDVDFVDGVAFARGDLVLSRARFVDDAPWVSDYTFEHIYYRSLRERPVDYLTARDYLWRWDTDWFWCSKNVGAQHPLLRRLYGRTRLNSITYQKIMRWNSRVGAMAALNRWRGIRSESVIQDVDIPIAQAAEFLDFLHAEVGILPIWICPIRAPDPGNDATLYPLPRGTLSVNFGFWDTVASRDERPRGFVNRKIERKVAEVGGIKSLYSDSYFTEDEFWSIYDREAYRALKARYDPKGVLGDLYRKVVLHR